MQKIAIPVLNHKLSPHFGLCSHFKFYWEDGGKIIKEDLIPAPAQKPEVIPNWLAGKNVTDVIVAGIGFKPIEILNQNKINVFAGVKMKDLNELIKEFMNGTLETNGNLCDH